MLLLHFMITIVIFLFLLLLLFLLFCMVNVWSPASVPASRDNKPGWYKLHNKYAASAYTIQNVILYLIGDSIVAGLTRYE